MSRKLVAYFSASGVTAKAAKSLTAIAKLAPDAVMGEGLSIHYSGGSSLSADVSDWLAANNIPTN